MIFLFSFYPAIAFACLSSDLTENTTFSNRSLGFSVSNSLISISTILLGLSYELIIHLEGLSMAAFNIVFVSLGVATVGNIIIVVFFYKPVKNEENPEKKPKNSNFSRVLNMKRFWKTFAVLMICGISIGMSFAPGYVLPIYMDRELGSSTGYGLVFASYYSFLAFWCLSLNFVVEVFSLYNTLIIGSAIVALGPLVFLIGNNFYIIAAYICIVAAGSSVLGARHCEYIGACSVKGFEIYYYGLLSPSYSFSSLCIGLVAGFTLDSFCPEHGKRESWIMWMIISLISFLPCLLLLGLRKWIDVRRDNEEHDPYVFSPDE
jgi:hypothetical protein